MGNATTTYHTRVKAIRATLEKLAREDDAARFDAYCDDLCGCIDVGMILITVIDGKTASNTVVQRFEEWQTKDLEEDE